MKKEYFMTALMAVAFCGVISAANAITGEHEGSHKRNSGKRYHNLGFDMENIGNTSKRSRSDSDLSSSSETILSDNNTTIFGSDSDTLSDENGSNLKNSDIKPFQDVTNASVKRNITNIPKWIVNTVEYDPEHAREIIIEYLKKENMNAEKENKLAPREIEHNADILIKEAKRILLLRKIKSK